MYDLSELTDLIHGCPGAFGPHDLNDPEDVAEVADDVLSMSEDSSPIGRLLADAADDVDLLLALVLALAGLGQTLRERGVAEQVTPAVLALYAAKLPPPLGPWLAAAVSLAD